MDYTGLQTAVADFVNRADLYGTIPTLITLAEAQIKRRLQLEGVQGAVTRATTTISAEYETVPGDFAGPITMTVYDTTNARWLPLENVTAFGMSVLKSERELTPGIPDRYAVVDGSFEFSPIPDQSYTVDLVYFGDIPALSSTNTTNWVLTDHPDAYLYGALCIAAPYLRDTGEESLIGTWRKMFDQAIGEIVASERRKRGPMWTPAYRATDAALMSRRRRSGFNIVTGL